MHFSERICSAFSRYDHFTVTFKSINGTKTNKKEKRNTPKLAMVSVGVCRGIMTHATVDPDEYFCRLDSARNIWSHASNAFGIASLKL